MIVVICFVVLICCYVVSLLCVILFQNVDSILCVLCFVCWSGEVYALHG